MYLLAKCLWFSIYSYLSSNLEVVVFTNQAGIRSGKVKVSDYVHKIESIAAKLGVPLQLFAATGQDLFRKPRVGMWDLLTAGEKFNRSVSIDMGEEDNL